LTELLIVEFLVLKTAISSIAAILPVNTLSRKDVVVL